MIQIKKRHRLAEEVGFSQIDAFWQRMSSITRGWSINGKKCEGRDTGSLFTLLERV
jgi:hypothetical protein